MNKETRSNIIAAILYIGLFIGIFFFIFLQKQNEQTQSTNAPTPTSEVFVPVATPTPWNCISSSQAYNYVGQYACVTYYVGSPIENSDGNVFLNERSDWWNGFSAYIPSDIASQDLTTPDGDSSPWMPYYVYGNKSIEVLGIIKLYRNAPEIVISSPSQIRYTPEQAVKVQQEWNRTLQQLNKNEN